MKFLYEYIKQLLKKEKVDTKESTNVNNKPKRKYTRKKTKV